MRASSYLRHLEHILGYTREAEVGRAAAGHFFRTVEVDAVPPSSALDVDRFFSALCKQKRIEVIAGLSAAGRAARLYTCDRGYQIRVRSNVSQSSFRFLLAHECAHTLSYDDSRPRPLRLIPNTALEEKTCDTIARALLIPHVPAQAQDLTEVDDVMREAIRLAEQWNVVLWQAVRRLLDERASSDFAAVLWEMSEVPLVAREARIRDVCTPRGIYVPVGDRAVFGDGNASGVWMAQPGVITAQRDIIRTGSLSGVFDVALATAARGRYVTQVIRLDAAHQAKIAAWRQQRHDS
jgi:hypothetical protein